MTYGDTAELEAECALVAGAPFAQTFMTAASPGIVASAMDNRFYPSQEEYVRAVADRTADRVPLHRRSRSAAADRRARSRHGAAHVCSPIVRSTSSSTGSSWSSTPSTTRSTGIDPSNVRLHVCWGNYEGPHTLDVPLNEILSRLYEANVGALVMSMANARHAHEYACSRASHFPTGWC